MERTRFQSPMVIFAALLALASLPACGADGTDVEPGAQSKQALPSWLVDVRPDPGVEDSTLKLVEVEHTVQTGGRDVRLIIDGVDVTAFADFGSEERITGPGHILFDPINDPQAAETTVTLDAGEHTATAQLVELDEIGGQEQVVDSFTWTFSIK